MLGVAVLQPEDTRGDIGRHMLDVAGTHRFVVACGHENFYCLVVIAVGTLVERTLHDGKSRIAIPIGTDKMSNDILYWSPTPDSGTPNPHLLVVGESGSGKTYATQCICTVAKIS